MRGQNEANVFGNDCVVSSLDSVHNSARGLVTGYSSSTFYKKRLLQKEAFAKRRMEEVCGVGHPVTRRCHSKTQDPCGARVRDKCAVGHARERQCHATEECRECDRLRRIREMEEKRRLEAEAARVADEVATTRGLNRHF